MAVDEKRMRELTEGLPSKAAKIRALDEAGFTRSDIAKFLDIRYQHVRNVLVQLPPRKTPGLSEPPQALLCEAPSAEAGETPPAKVTVEPGGRIGLPASFRGALGIEDGDTLVVTLEDGDIRLLTMDGAVRRAQAMVRRFVPEGGGLVDLLIEDRVRAHADEKG